MNETRNQVPVLLFGSGMTALGVIRCFGRRGIPVYSVEETSSYIRRSRWFQFAPRPSGAPDPRTNLSGYLTRLPFERAVLIASADSWVRRLANLDEELSERFPSSVSPPEVLGRLMDKAALSDSVQAAGIPHPRTERVGTVADLEALPDSAFIGAFLKPVDSEAFLGRYGIKAFNIRSRAEAEARLHDLEDSRIPVLLQEYIPGPPSNHLFIDGFIDWSGRTLARFARQRLRMYPGDFGNSTYMKTIPLADVADAAHSLRQLLAHADYRGIFSAEFKLDDRDGLFKILEVNVRPWWYVEFAARCGVDVCYLAYLDALRREPVPIAEYQVGAHLVYPHNDYFSYRALRRKGELSLGQWLRSCVGATQPIFCRDDPLPAAADFAYFVRSRFHARRPYRGPERRRVPRTARK